MRLYKRTLTVFCSLSTELPMSISLWLVMNLMVCKDRWMRSNV